MQTKLTASEPIVNGQFVDPTAVPNPSEKMYSGISREFNNFVTDMEDLIKSTTSLTGEDLAAAKVKLEARIAAARDSMAELGGTITQRARKSAAATNNYVRENPWQAIGVGALVGVLLGYVLGRRS